MPSCAAAVEAIPKAPANEQIKQAINVAVIRRHQAARIIVE